MFDMAECRNECVCRLIHSLGEDGEMLRLTFPLRKWNSLQITYMNVISYLPVSRKTMNTFYLKFFSLLTCNVVIPRNAKSRSRYAVRNVNNLNNADCCNRSCTIGGSLALS